MLGLVIVVGQWWTKLDFLNNVGREVEMRRGCKDGTFRLALVRRTGWPFEFREPNIPDPSP
jgi:hypothetical protein